MKIFLLFIFSFSIKASDGKEAEREVICPEIVYEGQRTIEFMKTNMKEGKEIDFPFSFVHELIEKYPLCLSYDVLKLSDNDIAKFRKYIHAPDRSFNLPEKECTTVSIDTTHMPENTVQEKLPWCFAYSGTELFSFHEEERFAVYDMIPPHYESSYYTAKDREQFLIRGGDTYTAMEEVLKRNTGMCLEDNINPLGLSWKKMNDMIFNIGNSSKKFSEILCENQHNEQDAFEKLSADVLPALDKLFKLDRFKTLIDAQCLKRAKFKNKYKLHTLNVFHKESKPKDMIEQMDKILSKNEPVNVGYNWKVIAFGVNQKNKISDHASTVIGRRFNHETGQCEYQLKNNWGDYGCQFAKSVVCIKGDHWVPRTALKNNIESVVWLEKTK